LYPLLSVGVKSKDDEKRVQRFERAANEYRLERKYVRAAECSRLAAYSYDFVGAKQDYAEKLSEAVRMYARAGTMTALQSAFAILSEELEKALLNAGLGAKNFDAAAAGAVDGALEGYQEGHITAAEFVDLIPTIQDAAPGRMKAQVTAKIVDVLIGQGDYKEAAAQFKELVSAQVLDIDSRDEAIIINCAKGFLCVTAVLARSDNDADFVVRLALFLYLDCILPSRCSSSPQCIVLFLIVLFSLLRRRRRRRRTRASGRVSVRCAPRVGRCTRRHAASIGPGWTPASRRCSLPPTQTRR
jgi:hypothetical protein